MPLCCSTGVDAALPGVVMVVVVAGLGRRPRFLVVRGGRGAHSSPLVDMPSRRRGCLSWVGEDESAELILRQVY